MKKPAHEPRRVARNWYPAPTRATTTDDDRTHLIALARAVEQGWERKKEPAPRTRAAGAE